MKESDLEADCKDLADMLGWVAYKGRCIKFNGASDDIFLKDGRGFTAEIKDEHEGVQSRAQIREQRFCTERGVPYYLIFTLEQFKEALLIEEAKL